MAFDRWLRRTGLVLGGLALVAELWTALSFVQTWVAMWLVTRPELVSFVETTNRFSQLKTPALKYPYAAVYFVLFTLALFSLLLWLLVQGVRDALTRDPQATERDDR